MPVSLGDSVREVTGGAVGTCPGVGMALQSNSHQGHLAKHAPAAKGPQGSGLLGQREPWPLQRLSPTSHLLLQAEAGCPALLLRRCHWLPCLCPAGGALGLLGSMSACMAGGTPSFRVVPSLQTCACYRGWGPKRVPPSVQPRVAPGEVRTTGQLPGWL